MNIRSKFSSKEGILAKNTVMLFLLTFSNYLFNFLTVPYQTRVLGPEIYGNIGFATSIMTYFQLFLDFGFLLSATEAVSRNRDDKKTVSEIFTAVTLCKLILVAVSFGMLAVVCATVGRFHEDVSLFMIYLAAYALYAFIPDFLYRGIENMQAITVRSVLIKFFFTCMIFVFLRNADQYYVIPVMIGLGNFGALVGVWFHLRHLGYGFVKVTLSEIIRQMKSSAFFFFSRVATAVYTATNTFLLGMIYGSGAALVGYYSTSEKAVSIAKQAITPVTDSLYPYMIKHRDFRLVKRLLLIGLPIIFTGCAVVMIFAKPLCAFVFGAEYYEAGGYLRLLAPAVFFSFPAMIFGFPVMSPLGLSKHANLSTVFGAAVQVVLLLVLYFAIGITPAKVCIVTCITEGLTCFYRVLIVWNHRRRMTSGS